MPAVSRPVVASYRHALSALKHGNSPPVGTPSGIPLHGPTKSLRVSAAWFSAHVAPARLPPCSGPRHQGCAAGRTDVAVRPTRVRNGRTTAYPDADQG